ncbi:MAG: hypothetical protein K2L29_04115 [Duncaniella sp.]|nr:hypothetical protein [Duncaniella sp.]
MAIPIAFYTGYITSRHTLRHNTQEQIHSVISATPSDASSPFLPKPSTVTPTSP